MTREDEAVRVPALEEVHGVTEVDVDVATELACHRVAGHELAGQAVEHRFGRLRVDQPLVGVVAEDVDRHGQAELALEPVVDLHVGPDRVLVPDRTNALLEEPLLPLAAFPGLPQQAPGDVHALR